MNPQDSKPLERIINESLVNENTRTAVLNEAAKIISADRAVTHGDAEKSFEAMADYWTTYLQKENVIEPGVRIWPRQVGMMMILFKLARTHNNPKHRDNYVDMAGYVGCAAEIALKDS